jgi:hypothetical protein
MDKRRFYYKHGETADGYRWTVAGQFARQYSGKQRLEISIAICSKKDTFCKSQGRMKAQKKLEGGWRHNVNVVCPILSCESEADRFVKAMDDIRPHLSTRKNIHKSFGLEYYDRK